MNSLLLEIGVNLSNLPAVPIALLSALFNLLCVWIFLHKAGAVVVCKLFTRWPFVRVSPYTAFSVGASQYSSPFYPGGSNQAMCTSTPRWVFHFLPSSWYPLFFFIDSFCCHHDKHEHVWLSLTCSLKVFSCYPHAIIECLESCGHVLIVESDAHLLYQ